MFTVQKTYHGFTLQQSEQVPEMHGTAYLFFHEKSGARLFYIQNEDPNKVFSVAFQTPVENDCGTPHILEHSVLCGSMKYPSKDPFNELAKGSLYTFLNAMTYADKTMYPIASCNEKDFHNMMDVYLDAVFHPNIYQNKAIFMQEGWHYEIGEDGKLQVSGVVYNEMKGVYSDPEAILAQNVSRVLFGDTVYAMESGGTPEAIPTLRYEDFLAFHQKYYHPSNSYFFLYGNMEPLACLEHIDSGYLAEYDRSYDLPQIGKSPDFTSSKFENGTYPAQEESEKSTYLSYAVKTVPSDDVYHTMALDILMYILLETQASP